MTIKVLISSESTFRRSLIAEMISSHNGIEVVGNAGNVEETDELIKTKNLDVLILDVEFKKRDWVKPFNNIIRSFNFATIVLTDVNPKKLDVLDIPFILKSYDYIIKPDGLWKKELPKIRDVLISKVLLIDIPRTHKIDSKARLLDKDIFVKRSQKQITKTESDSKDVNRT